MVNDSVDAPKVTQESIDSIIDKVVYFTGKEGLLGSGISVDDTEDTSGLGLLTICIICLKNGFKVIGHSACVSPENFNQKTGREIAYKNAEQQIWALEGYLLMQKMSTST